MLTLFDQEYVLDLERDSIRASALAEGIMKNKTQVVLNMFRDNMSYETVARINDLSVEEVKDILKKAAVLH